MEQEEYRGFLIQSLHGWEGEIVGYAVSVDDEATSEIVGEEIGSIAGDFPSIEAAKRFIDAEMGVKVMQGSPWDEGAGLDN